MKEDIKDTEIRIIGANKKDSKKKKKSMRERVEELTKEK